MRFKAGVAALILCLATVAQANGAMGLGLEMWDLRYWFAYVVVMVGLEAWLIGRWIELSWTKSVLLSIGANAITGVACGAGGLFAPFLHMSFVGSRMDPNPFVNAVVLLTVFALPSAWLESVVWRWAKKPEDVWRFVKRVLVVHLATVPVGLAILLIPEHPYQGMEAMTDYNRRTKVRRIERALQQYVMVNEALPESKDVRGLARELEEHSMNYDENEIVLVLHRPELTRFSTGERWNHPFEINPELVGKRFDGGPEDMIEEEKWVWYVRRPDVGTGYGWGLSVELNSWTVKAEFDEVILYGK
ncbi:MAG: hypothetical protein IH944_08645 [Armatimonadetes bacterium]|nr:hypothetical protein [Armatimonadota bacterium]